MGGFFGAVGKSDVISNVFYGTDYHSHLGVKRGGVAAYNAEDGLQREIHNIENSPFRTKFADIFDDFSGCSAIGCISDSDPQPLLIRSKLGKYAICIIGKINNAEDLIKDYLDEYGAHFDTLSGSKVNLTELVTALINHRDTFAEGIRFAQSVIDGTASILILQEGGKLIAARDKLGRIPIIIGKGEDGYCVTFESFAAYKLGYKPLRDLGPGEIVEISADGVEVLMPALEEMKICSFLWTYYGYPASCYEGVNVEYSRCKNGEIMAKSDAEEIKNYNIDYVAGVPDSGTPHAIGYARESGIPFARPFIKYTPTWSRSFTPSKQSERNKVAKAKLLPVEHFIDGKNLLFVDDSIVRGTQLKGTVDFLYENGAKEVHIRSACPPIFYSCKYLNFTRSTSEMELIARCIIVELEGEEGLKYISEYADGTTVRGKNLRKKMAEKFHCKTVEFQSLDGLCKSIGVDKCKLCTYCWTGKE
ncbi:MAG: amidophosphoribosyltransferase [Clostridia bacterium]|nr:amidophosphoribosyltransferase [Clostridia bacterium]